MWQPEAFRVAPTCQTVPWNIVAKKHQLEGSFHIILSYILSVNVKINIEGALYNRDYYELIKSNGPQIATDKFQPQYVVVTNGST